MKKWIIISIIAVVLITVIVLLVIRNKKRKALQSQEQETAGNTALDKINNPPKTGPLTTINSGTQSGPTAPITPTVQSTIIKVGDSIEATKQFDLYNSDLFQSIYRRAKPGEYIGVVTDVNKPSFYTVKTASGRDIKALKSAVKKV